MLKDNVEKIQNELHKINSNAKILAATKTVPCEIINQLYDLGIHDIGENKVQELLEKYENIDKRLNLHFIGRLQKNKVKYIIDKVKLIHSLDNFELAQEIDKQAKKRNLIMDVLLQINIGEDDNKGGVLLKDAETFIESLKNFDNLNIKGLMTVLPLNSNSGELYLQLYNFYDKIKSRYNFKVLSMGLSNDYLIAASQGATMVRIGRALFGERKY